MKMLYLPVKNGVGMYWAPITPSASYEMYAMGVTGTTYHVYQLILQTLPSMGHVSTLQ